jgi:hypothetical protein
MSTYPVSYAKETGEGRRTKLIWLPQNKVSSFDKHIIRTTFPAARQILRGKDLLNENGTIIFIDLPLNSGDVEVAGVYSMLPLP